MSCRCAAIHAAGFFRRLGQILADCCCLTRMSEGFLSADYADVADYGGMSCRCAAIHAAGFFRRLGQILADCFGRVAGCGGGRFFYPQITQISADYGGMSCRCAAIHAAGFFRRLGQILADCCCLTRMSEGFYPLITQMSQIRAACLAAARQFTPPDTLLRPLRLVIQIEQTARLPVFLVLSAARLGGRTYLKAAGSRFYSGRKNRGALCNLRLSRVSIGERSPARQTNFFSSSCLA
jgi:hypothetical protein